MNKPFSKAAPDKRAGFLRRQRPQPKRQTDTSKPLPQVMPPLKVTSLEDERRDIHLGDALFNKSSRPVNASRPPMMNLVYPPLKEAELTVQRKPTSNYKTVMSKTATLYGKLVGKAASGHKGEDDQEQADQPVSSPLPRSVYVNPRMVMPQPESRKAPRKQMNIGWRLLSLVLAGAMGYAIFFMWTSPLFKMNTPSVTGNARVASEDFLKVINVDGKHSFAIVPSEIKNTLLNTFPELVSANLDYHFPNQMSLIVSEREPVLIWKQGGQTVWIDLFGIPMNPRGDPGNWYVVTAEGNAISPVAIDPINKPGEYKPVVGTDLILMILNLANMTPAGTSIAYDSRYGMGWNDPAGWKVFFGFNTAGFESKLAQYEGIVTNLNDQGIQPRIISVQYPYAPFYRLEQ
jgi:hypothetical protein